MKKYLIVFVLLFSIYSQSQTYVKLNPLTTLLSIPNVGIETSLGKKTTFQVDITGTYWQSVNGKPFKFLIFIPEYRYHFHEKYDGFYVGGHIGGTVFSFQKWNYLNTDKYENGFGYVMGVTVGYEKKINDRFMLDVFVGGGNSQGFYHGYDVTTGQRYENVTNWNKSGEWLPYRGGVMVSYRLN
jgi:Protein of unknown function (DUF3575)